MKKRWISLLRWGLPVVLVVLFSSFVRRGDKPTFRVWVEQGKHRYAVDSQDVVLRKRPFRFVVEMEGLSEVYLNANTLDTALQHARRGEVPFQDEFGPNCMAEETFNEAHCLHVANDALSCWFYDPTMDWNRFDKGARNFNGVIKGTKTITNMSFLEQHDGRPSVEVEAKNFEKPVYLVFMSLASEKPQVIGLVKYCKLSFE